MRKVISIDGTHLKNQFGGNLLIATTQDGKFQIYPLVFGIVDYENDASWNWFLTCLRDQVPDTTGLVFISDRHKSIIKGIRNNIKTKFSGKGLKRLFEKTTKAYKFSEFTNLFVEISTKKPSLATYLKKASFESWSRGHFHVDKEDIMRQRYEKSRYMRVTLINLSKFRVNGEPLDDLVNIEEHSCTCREFDIDKIPCAHGVAAATYHGVDIYSLCSKFYMTEFWRMAYAESIYPLPLEIEWQLQEEVKSQVVINPVKLIPQGDQRINEFLREESFQGRRLILHLNLHQRK
ncbi:uncharacterized protein LOC133814301 [Humulus lupulus]|uniref:uncharacterized protein LOC133814301 n=1 Tax=Humulus lupulus TaxID=3486 RepID=UPI002B406548|nr:uncharacterized protein LOC133814301 [Humulus lupulus]